MRTREHLIWAGAMLVAVCVISAAVWYPAHERLAIVERMQEVKPVCAPILGVKKHRTPSGRAVPPGQYESPGVNGTQLLEN